MINQVQRRINKDGRPVAVLIDAIALSADPVEPVPLGDDSVSDIADISAPVARLFGLMISIV